MSGRAGRIDSPEPIVRQLWCDVAVIGAGTAGLSARAAAVAEGARVLLIEAGPGGTTCARTGCMPSKLLIAAAGAADAARRLGVFGLGLEGQVTVDGPAVLARLRHERDRFVGAVLADVGALPTETVLSGRARFLGPTTLAVGDDVRVEARAIVIAVGSRPTIPEPLRGLGDLVLANESVFELTDLPDSLAVVGAGPLGIELAQAFARLGVRVVVLDQGDVVGGLRDPDVASAAHAVLGGEVPIHLGVAVEAEAAEGGVRLTWTSRDGAGSSATFARVLVAAGRAPAFDRLGLGQAGLALDESGIPQFDPETLRCGDAPIFIAGDADGDRPVLHEAVAEGAIAGRNAARWPSVEPSPRGVALSIVYTDPEIAVVGPAWPTLEAKGAVAASVDIAESGRARIMDRNAGLLRVYAEPSGGRVLGGAMVGPEAEHLGHLLAFAVQSGLTVEAMLALPYYHPSLEESLRAALRKLQEMFED